MLTTHHFARVVRKTQPSDTATKKLFHLLDDTLFALNETVVHGVVHLHDRGLRGIAPEGFDLRPPGGIEVLAII
jgi:hypothetical protein